MDEAPEAGAPPVLPGSTRSEKAEIGGRQERLEQVPLFKFETRNIHKMGFVQ
ncbi:hypothetical protein FOMG_17644 [Fusarium oxysporum f. sp. melonis 26406]|uniref:Uncharacterized protein n=1 Tax=Fusarium oxysporum f. sp. melonis 26406 TaxID=1089452 RepID=W9Z2U4_FUSOX|nr:hypothetical protein FOMG_17644 [Fusarium oxysporum f. sp. melonis 26406]